MQTTRIDIEKKIELLEQELAYLKKQVAKEKTVNVPEPFKAIFDEAEKSVSHYFSQLKFSPHEGSIQIDDERYILVRASSLSNEFFENFAGNLPDKTEEEAFSLARDFLFDTGHLIGMEDARRVHTKINLTDPISKLSAGPVHFSHAGWAFVDILPESNPSPDKNFFLKYNHPYSFEADSWIKSGKKSEKPVCIMNAAYSSGWCEESFNMPLTAVEISCRAKGDEHCTFIMAQPDRIAYFLNEETKGTNLSGKIEVPYFFERRIIEEKLKSNQKLLEEAQAIAKLAAWEYDLETHEFIWTKELRRIYGVEDQANPKEMQQGFLDTLSEEDLIYHREMLDEAAKNGTEYHVEHQIRLKDNTVKWIITNGIPVRDKEGKIYKIKGITQDITSQKDAEEIMIRNDKMLKTAQQIAKIGSWEFDITTSTMNWSDEMYNICEIDKNTVTDLREEFYTKIKEDDMNAMRLLFQTCIREGTSYNIEFDINLGLNRKKTLYGLGMAHYNSKKEIVKIYGIAQDISESKRQNKALIENIKEKETLLKEVHHRVKNNLQIISSLLNLQSSFIENEEMLKLYRESQNRIKSIASVHELLYQSDDLSKISFDRYLKKLVDDLIISYFGIENKIKLFINTREFFNIDTSIPLGLLINEIVSNSLKHGLKNEANEFIYIDIFKIRHKTYQLKIGDNGRGFVSASTDEDPESLGLMLIKELSEQLNGEIIKNTENQGTHYELIFKSN
ncbi:MAG: histidine kinase dimerization/phosphoacceptor domain -containing protein [Bacteroidota bacterium]